MYNPQGIYINQDQYGPVSFVLGEFDIYIFKYLGSTYFSILKAIPLNITN